MGVRGGRVAWLGDTGKRDPDRCVIISCIWSASAAQDIDEGLVSLERIYNSVRGLGFWSICKWETRTVSSKEAVEL